MQRDARVNAFELDIYQLPNQCERGGQSVEEKFDENMRKKNKKGIK